jgi:hypothetical protein
MREILCKAKRKDNGKWIEGYYFKSWACKNGNKYDVHLIHNYELDDGWKIDVNTLCQLTHMTDVNGNKIWENDIVITSNGFVLQVVWSDKYQEFLFKNLKGGYDFMKGMVSELSSFTRDKKIKIVGNVFDDLDLVTI